MSANHRWAASPDTTLVKCARCGALRQVAMVPSPAMQRGVSGRKVRQTQFSSDGGRTWGVSRPDCKAVRS